MVEVFGFNFASRLSASQMAPIPYAMTLVKSSELHRAPFGIQPLFHWPVHTIQTVLYISLWIVLHKRSLWLTQLIGIWWPTTGTECWYRTLDTTLTTMAGPGFRINGNPNGNVLNTQAVLSPCGFLLLNSGSSLVPDPCSLANSIAVKP